MFHQVLDFLGIRNLLYHLHTASQSLVEILCGQNGCLSLSLGMSTVIYESSAVCNDSDEFVQLGESSCDVFWGMTCNMYMSDFQIFCRNVKLCCRPAGWLLC